MGFSIKALAQRVAAEVQADNAETVTRGNHNTGTRHGGQSVTNVRVSGDHHEGDYIAGDYAEHVYGDQTS